MNRRRPARDADPRRPYKAYAAAIVAGLTALAAYADILPPWVLVASAVGVAALSTFTVPNPRRRAPRRVQEVMDAWRDDPLANDPHRPMDH